MKDLKYAIKYSSPDSVEKILQNKKLENSIEHHNLLKLALNGSKSVYKRDLDVYETLIKHGAPIAGYEEPGRDTLLHHAAAKDIYITYLHHSHIDNITDKLLESGLSIVALNGKNETPMHIAAKCDNRTLLDVMINKYMEKREELSNITDQDGVSLFHIVCSMPDVKHVVTFLKQVPSIDIDATVSVDSEHFSGYSAIHFAAAHCRSETIKLLIDHGANPYLLTKTGLNLLHLVCIPNCRWLFHESTNAVQEKKYTNIWHLRATNNIKDALQNYVSMVDTLVNDLNFDIDIKDFDDNNALTFVVARGRTYLSNFYFNCVSPQYTLQKNRLLTVDGKYCALQIGNFQNEVVRLAAAHSEAMLHKIFECYEKKKSLKPEQVLNLTTSSGSTYFYELAKKVGPGGEEVNESFFKMNVNLNEGDKNHSTLLHTAVKERHVRLLNFIVRSGKTRVSEFVNFNAQDDLGNTPLHYVGIKIFKSTITIIVRLLKFGSDVNIENENGDTALSIVLGCLSKVRLKSTHTELLNRVVRYQQRYKQDYYVIDTLEDLMTDTDELKELQDDSYAELPQLWECLIALKICNQNVKQEVDDFINEFTDKLLVREASRRYSSEFKLKCEKEVGSMKETRIINRVTLHDFLTKNIDKVIVHTENPDLRQLLESADLKAKFPVYANLLKARLARALVRGELFDDARISLQKTNGYIPVLCIAEILSYLSEKKLRDLVQINVKNDRIIQMVESLKHSESQSKIRKIDL